MAKWIFPKENVNITSFYYFKKEFEVEDFLDFEAVSFGETRYQLYINGQLAVEGPCMGPENTRYYERSNLTKYLRSGKNEISAKVLFTDSYSFISVYDSGSPSFYFDGTIRQRDGQLKVETDETWEIYKDNSVEFHNEYYYIMLSVPPTEDHLERKEMTRLEPSFVYYWPGLTNEGINEWGLYTRSRKLLERPIPQMTTLPMTPLNKLYEKDNKILLDRGRFCTAKLRFRFKANKGSKIKFIYFECFSKIDKDGKMIKDKRDDYESVDSIPSLSVFDSFISSGEIDELSPFWYRSFRYVMVEFEENSSFELIETTYAIYEYPLEIEGAFHCSDDTYNKMWEISKNTVLSCMHEIYVDCPFYEQQQYDMDSMLEMLFTFRLSSDYRLPLKSIIDLSESQIPEGFLQANYPSRSRQIIPNFTLFFIMMVEEYIKHVGIREEERETIRGFLGTIDKALNAFDLLRDENGLVKRTKYWDFIDWVPSWKNGVPGGNDNDPITVSSLMYIKALDSASYIFNKFGNKIRSGEYGLRADEMRDAVIRNCYSKEERLFKDGPNTNTFSEHTTIWAVLSETVKNEDARTLIENTFKKVNISKASFSMNYFMFRALEKTNMYQYAPKLFEGWKKMMDMHCTTWCENPDNPRSECHGWSSTPIFELSSCVLGVKMVSEGCEEILISPDLDTFGLTDANGSVPTPYGTVQVLIEKTGDQILYKLIIPDGIKKAVLRDLHGIEHTLTQIENEISVEI